MDHREVEERELASGYLRGALTAEDEERFEEHLLDCATCFERVRWEDELGAGLREAAAEDLAAGEAGGAFGAAPPATPVRGRRSWVPALLAAGLIVAIALPGYLLWQRERRALERSAQEAVAAERARAAAAEGELAQTRRRLGERIASLDAQIAAERVARERLSEGLAPSLGPRGNTVLFRLGASRGTGGQRPENRVALGAEPEWVVLTFELATTDFPAYRAELFREPGETVWSGDGLRPGDAGTFALSFPSSDLGPGTYRLHLEGLSAADRGVPVADFRFEVTHGS